VQVTGELFWIDHRLGEFNYLACANGINGRARFLSRQIPGEAAEPSAREIYLEYSQK